MNKINDCIYEYTAGSKYDYRVSGFRKDFAAPNNMSAEEVKKICDSVANITVEDFIRECLTKNGKIRAFGHEDENDEMAYFMYKDCVFFNVFLKFQKISLKTGRSLTGKTIERRLYYNKDIGLYVSMGKYKLPVKDFGLQCIFEAKKIDKKDILKNAQCFMVNKINFVKNKGEQK